MEIIHIGSYLLVLIGFISIIYRDKFRDHSHNVSIAIGIIAITLGLFYQGLYIHTLHKDKRTLVGQLVDHKIEVYSTYKDIETDVKLERYRKELIKD